MKPVPNFTGSIIDIAAAGDSMTDKRACVLWIVAYRAEIVLVSVPWLGWGRCIPLESNLGPSLYGEHTYSPFGSVLKNLFNVRCAERSATLVPHKDKWNIVVLSDISNKGFSISTIIS